MERGGHGEMGVRTRCEIVEVLFFVFFFKKELSEENGGLLRRES